MNFEVNTKSPNPYIYCLKWILFVTITWVSCFSLEIMQKSHVEMPCPRFGCTSIVLLGFVLELRTDTNFEMVEKQYIRVTKSTLCPFWRLTQWPTSGNISLKLALDTKWITPIDLSCRVVRVVAWALGLVSRWGSPLRSVFTPSLRSWEKNSIRIFCVARCMWTGTQTNVCLLLFCYRPTRNITALQAFQSFAMGNSNYDTRQHRQHSRLTNLFYMHMRKVTDYRATVSSSQRSGMHTNTKRTNRDTEAFYNPTL